MNGAPQSLREHLGTWWKRAVRSPSWLSAVGVIAAGVLVVEVNILVARHYSRWDFTTRGMYTLSQPTLDTLGALSAPVEITVLISKSDRLLIDARHMLDAYRAESPRLQIRYVDPDTDAAEFLALQKRHGIAAGQTQDGRVVTDASFIISQGDHHWFVTPNELIAYDDEGNARPRLEAVLTEGIARVTSPEQTMVCFTEGHGELSIDDVGPNGLAELRRRLLRSNFTVEPRVLDGPQLDPNLLSSCALVIVAGPERPFGSAAASLLRSHVERGRNALLLLDPVVDDEGRLQPSGLGPLLEAVGVTVTPQFVIEEDPSSRLPRGVGEAFFAEPKTHPITRGLARGEDQVQARPLVVATQPLGTTDDSNAQPLLESSPSSFAVRDLRPLEEAGGAFEKRPNDDTGPFYLAVANQLAPTTLGDETAKESAPTSGTSDEHPPARGARAVVVGTSNVAWAQNWADPTLFGTRLFAENAIAWLTDRPALVSVPEKAAQPAGLALTEASLGEVRRYVLVYMPLTAALAGLLILLRRRRQERVSRRPAS